METISQATAYLLCPSHSLTGFQELKMALASWGEGRERSEK